VQRQRVCFIIVPHPVACVHERGIQMARKVAKMAKQTHKDRVHEFNEKLESLSEHHDIPKVRSF
jgi:hypothetical protein